jgi:hypothetical protein
MTITLIKEGDTLKQIVLGEIDETTQKWIDSANANPLIKERWIAELKYTNKSLYDIQDFIFSDKSGF